MAVAVRRSVASACRYASQLDFDGDERGAVRFARAIDQLAAIGDEVCPFDIAPMLAVTRLLYGGAFVAERYEAVGAFVDDAS